MFVHHIESFQQVTKAL